MSSMSPEAVWKSMLLLWGVVLLFWAFMNRLARPDQDSRPHCGACNYDLTGATSDCCPECGGLFLRCGIRVGVPVSRSGAQLANILLAVATTALVLSFLLPSVYGAARSATAVRAAAPRDAPASSPTTLKQQGDSRKELNHGGAPLADPHLAP